MDEDDIDGRARLEEEELALYRQMREQEEREQAHIADIIKQEVRPVSQLV